MNLNHLIYVKMTSHDLQKVEEIIEIKMLKMKYFRGSIWNIVDLVWIQIDLIFRNLTRDQFIMWPI